MEPAGSFTTNIGIEKELICSTRVSIAELHRESAGR